ncbi:MAG: hypothetical protein AAGA93_10305 [Actinomycetota bacterium]
MAPRLPALLDRPVVFGRADPDAADPSESGLAELDQVIERGARAVAADVWLTADGVPVLDRTGRLGGRLRRRTVAKTPAADLPPTTTRLDELLASIGADRPLSLDIRDAGAFEAVIGVARDAASEDRLWLCHPSVATLTPWRPETSARLVNIAGYRSLDGGLERRVADLEQRDIDGLRLDHQDWTGGRITLLHRFGRLALATGAVHEREMAALLDAGIDAFYVTRIEASVAVTAQYYDD